MSESEGLLYDASSVSGQMTKFCDKFSDISLKFSCGFCLYWSIKMQQLVEKLIIFKNKNGKICLIKLNNPKLSQNWAMQDAKV